MTRAMPSPTSVTRPTVRASSDGVEAVEVLLECRCDVGGGERQLSHVWSDVSFYSRRLQLVDAGADGAVDDGVADGGDEATEHDRVDDHLEVDALAGGVGERGLAGGRAGRR